MKFCLKASRIIFLIDKKNYLNYIFYESLTHASDFCRAGRFDGYVALGGGSVLDTCKAANLYASDPRAQFLDYVNPPIGKGKPVTVDLKPMIASK